MAWDGKNLWNVDTGTEIIYKLNPSDGSVIHSISAPGRLPRGVTWGGNFDLWGSDDTQNSIYKIYAGCGSILTDVQEEERIDILTQSFRLFQNYPNPFNPSTTINYQIPLRSHVRLTIYDLMGREITTLVDEEQNAGIFSVTWNAISKRGKKVPSGIFIYKLSVGSYSEAKKLILIK